MKWTPRILVFLLLALAPMSLQAQYDQPEYLDKEVPIKDHHSGWTMGTEQGVLFFVGNSSKFVNAQYYGTIFGGYNFKGYFMPIVRFGQAVGTMSRFGNPTSYWFIFEGGIRATPLRTMVRPYFTATAGVYILNFTNFGTPVQGGANFTFNTGGGVEVELGKSALTVGGAYRGFTNSGPYLQGVEVTLGYRFQF